MCRVAEIQQVVHRAVHFPRHLVFAVKHSLDCGHSDHAGPGVGGLIPDESALNAGDLELSPSGKLNICLRFSFASSQVPPWRCSCLVVVLVPPRPEDKLQDV